MVALGVLGSTRGTHLLSLLNAIHSKELAATIEVVISNKPEAIILERARVNGLKAEFIDPQGLNRSEYDALVSASLKFYKVDLVVLIGYMRILSAEFIKQWPNKVINVHPSLLPAYAGMMDLQVHQAVLDNKDKETGCTVHYVTEAVDEGPIILQKKCKVYENDIAETLKQRVQNLEAHALIEAIQCQNSLF